MHTEITNVDISLDQIINAVADRAAARALELHFEKTKSVHPEELWNKKQARLYLKVSYKTFEGFIEKGLVKPIKLGKTIRFDADKLKEQMYELRSHLYERTS